MKHLFPTFLLIICLHSNQFYIRAINAVRYYYGLSILRPNSQLMDSAYLRSQQIVSNWSHQGMTEAIRGTGYYWGAGENLAKDFACSTDAVIAWLHSPSHRANILESRYRAVGVATINGYTVMHFGTKL